MKISVSMIVKNKESCLEECLQSLIGFDEIIIIDTGSDDKTGEIARKYTDKYFPDEYKWEDSFCKARNYALSKCTGDWVLSIDADEYLERNGIEKIKKYIELAEKNNKKTIDCVMNSKNGKMKFYFPRLFKRCSEVYWLGDIHNYLSVSEMNYSDINIYYGYSLAHQNDPDRTLRILKKIVSENSESVREIFYLAREYWYRKDYITACYWYKNYLSKSYWPPEQAEAWYMLANCYLSLKNIEEAKNACLQAIKINPNFKEALIFMANLSETKHKSVWLKFATIADNSDVLFNRTGGN